MGGCPVALPLVSELNGQEPGIPASQVGLITVAEEFVPIRCGKILPDKLTLCGAGLVDGSNPQQEKKKPTGNWCAWSYREELHFPNREENSEEI